MVSAFPTMSLRMRGRCFSTLTDDEGEAKLQQRKSDATVDSSVSLSHAALLTAAFALFALALSCVRLRRPTDQGSSPSRGSGAGAAAAAAAAPAAADQRTRQAAATAECKTTSTHGRMTTIATIVDLCSPTGTAAAAVGRRRSLHLSV